MCSGASGVRASEGGRKSEQVGREGSGPPSELSSKRMRLASEPMPEPALRLPRDGEEDGCMSSRRCVSSRAFLTSRPAIVRERTISNARKPTMSTVSSLGFRSSEDGRLRNSLNRFARFALGTYIHECISCCTRLVFIFCPLLLTTYLHTCTCTTITFNQHSSIYFPKEMPQ